MKTEKEIAQWVVDNRYAKGEKENVSDSEMYHKLVESITKLCTISDVSKNIATEYAEFCVRCDREKLPLLCLEDYIKQWENETDDNF